MKKFDLDNIDKVNPPFEVPDRYFDALESKIQAEIDQKRGYNRPTAISWKWGLIPAMAVVILMILFPVFKNQQQETADQLVAELSSDDILTYLEQTDITEYDIATLTSQPEELLPESENIIEDIELSEDDFEGLLDQYDLNDIKFEEI